MLADERSELRLLLEQMRLEQREAMQGILQEPKPGEKRFRIDFVVIKICFVVIRHQAYNGHAQDVIQHPTTYPHKVSNRSHNCNSSPQPVTDALSPSLQNTSQ